MIPNPTPNTPPVAALRIEARYLKDKGRILTPSGRVNPASALGQMIASGLAFQDHACVRPTYRLDAFCRKWGIGPAPESAARTNPEGGANG